MEGAAWAATIPIYENFGIISSGPLGTNLPSQIDALAFANYGTFEDLLISYQNSLLIKLPYDFQNVRHFTNTGSMTGTPGFAFDTAFTDGKRVPAEDFFNGNGATITAVEGLAFPFGVNGILAPTFVNVFATNITALAAIFAWLTCTLSVRRAVTRRCRRSSRCCATGCRGRCRRRASAPAAWRRRSSSAARTESRGPRPGRSRPSMIVHCDTSGVQPVMSYIAQAVRPRPTPGASACRPCRSAARR